MSKKKKTVKKTTKKSIKDTSKSTLNNPRYLRRRRVSPLKVAFWTVLALLAAFVVYNMYRFFFDKSYDLPTTFSTSSSEKSASKTSSESSSEKKPSESKKSDSDSNNGKDLKQNEGSDPNALEVLTGSLTSANKSGDKLIIRVNIDQYLSSGTCSLVLKSGDSTVEKTASIFPTASTSSCEGFDIPLSELDSGDWSIIINLSSGDKVGKITGEVSL